ncbi:MAG TPA: SIMPL domain-containing protein [Flavobacteriales bacterium]|nr:SIMPL domain-containing protein [Flavobacteriales bacterium]
MNHLKHFILTGAVTFFALQAAAQTNDSKFIEVTATDSTQVIPDIIEYSFTLMPDNSVEAPPAYNDDDYNNPPVTNYAETQKKKQEEAMLKLKMLEKRFTELLSKEKITYSRKDPNSYNKYVYGYDYEYGYGSGDVKNKAFVVKFVSFDQLDKFLAKIPEDIKYNGNISSTSSSKIRDMESALLEKVVLKAKKQAETVARISGATLGTVLQFSDVSPVSTTAGNAGYDQLVNYLAGVYKGAAAQDDQRKIILTKTVRIRYSIQ